MSEFSRVNDGGASQRSAFAMGDVGGRYRNWGWIDEGPTSAVDERREVLRARARGLVRNAAYGWAVVEAITQRTIGTYGIQPHPVNTTQARNKRLSTLWEAWQADPAQVDFDGRLSFPALQDVAMRTMVTSGSVLVRFYVNPDPAAANPLQLRLLEPDYLATDRDGHYGANEVQGGIEFDAFGRVVAYHLYRQHPREKGLLTIEREVDRIERGELLHMFRDDRAGQKGGVSWLHPIGATVRDRALWSAASLTQQQMAACLALLLTDPSGSADPDEIDEALTMRPGMVAWLPPHREVQTLTPPSTEDHAEYDRSLLREIAAGAGISYEALTGDLSETNFSSAKLGQNKFQGNVNSWQQKILIPQLLNPIWRRWVELIRESRRGREPIGVQWTVPRRELIDPQKEWQAILIAVRAGFMTLGDAIRQQTGQQPEVVLEEIARMNELLDQYKLKLDSDPRAGMMADGDPNAEPGYGEDGEQGGEGDDAPPGNRQRRGVRNGPGSSGDGEDL